MTSANPFNTDIQGKTIEVDELLGDTYPYVKHVAANIEIVKHVSANLPAIYQVSLAADGLIVINDNIDAILSIAEDAPDYTLIVNNINELDAIYNSLDGILAAPALAESWADLAEKWAINPINTPVEVGEYSSYHWAQEASADSITAVAAKDTAVTKAAEVAAGLALLTSASWITVYGLEADGARFVMKIVGYVGGIGTTPTANVGKYLKADGTLTTVIADAANIRGPSGPGSGDMVASQNLSDLVDKAAAFGTIKQPASSTNTGVVELLTLAEIRTGTDDTRVPTIDGMYDALADVTITYVATNTPWDMSTGINFKLTLAGITSIDNPTNQLLNKSGRLKLIQDATGGRQPTWGSNFVFDTDTPPLIDTSPNSLNILYYDTIDTNTIFVSLAGRKVS